MKRFAILFVTLALLLALLPAAAQSTPDLTALAQYFPGQTPVYVSLRTDDGYIEVLESIRARFEAALPAGAMDDTTVPMALDASVRDMLQDDGSFAADVRPWLGDSVAFGLLNLDSMMEQPNGGPYLVALQISDRAAAEAFFAPIIARGGDMVVAEITDAYSLYTLAETGSGPMAIYFDDQALFITNKLEALPMGGPLNSPLAEQEAFQSAMATLPADGYNIAVYADYGAFMQAALTEASSSMSTGEAEMMAMVEPFFTAFGGAAVGFTVLDERALTMDLALEYDVSALGAMAPDMSSFAPFDPAFAIHLPAGTQLAIQGTGLSQSIEQGLDSLAMAQAMDPASGDDAPTAEELLAGINFVVRGATGLDLEEDILSWMTGQYAVGMSVDFAALLDAAMTGDFPPEALSFGVVIENTDQQGAEALVAGLTQTLNNFITPDSAPDAVLSEEMLGGAPGVTLTDVASGFQLAMGANDAVFALGTPDMVRAALSPDGGLDTDPAYQESLTWALDGTPVYLYASGDFFNALVELGIYTEMTRMERRPTAPELGTVLAGPLFSSSSISQTTGTSDVVARFVLTLE
jgi:hypothetical protein